MICCPVDRGGGSNAKGGGGGGRKGEGGRIAFPKPSIKIPTEVLYNPVAKASQNIIHHTN